jgi:hypothetical protein
MSNLSVFQKAGGIAAKKQLGIDGIVTSLSNQFSQAGGVGISSELALESFNGIDRMGQNSADQFIDGVKGIQFALESMVQDLAESHFSGMKDSRPTDTMMTAATIAATMAANPQGFANRMVPAFESRENGTMAMLAATSHDMVNARLSLEAYDERDNRSLVQYSTAYNLAASRQDEFGETFFPTVVVTPDQAGFSMSVRLIQVYEEQRRNVSGVVNPNFQKKNVIQAYIDPTILQNDQTKIVPVYQTASAPMFVSPSLVATQTVTIGSDDVDTGPLAMGIECDLMGISQRDSLLATGVLDSTDAIDKLVNLENLYLQLTGTVDGVATTEVVLIPTLRMPLSNFVAANQGLDQRVTLNFYSDSVPINAQTTLYNGQPSQILAQLVSGGYNVRLSFRVSGELNLQLGQTSLFAANVKVFSVKDNTGTLISTDSGNGETIANLFNTATLIGYDLDARFANMNRRQRGQLLDVSQYTQIYQVPLLAPITVPRPMTQGNSTDASDLAALIATTQIRTSNAAVTALQDIEATLAAYQDTTTEDNAILDFDNGLIPRQLGIASFLVQPYYSNYTLNIPDVIDSLTSSQRFEDIRNAIVNKIRDSGYRMYRDSGYKAAADTLYGGLAPAPTLLIGTDPVLKRYIIVDGDLRTAGITFDVKVVETMNINVKDKIYLTFGTKSGMEGTPDPLHFGFMAWKPELTVVLPLHRNGANSKELTVCPSFRHFGNLPVLTTIYVEGIEDVIDSKVVLFQHPVVELASS